MSRFPTDPYLNETFQPFGYSQLTTVSTFCITYQKRRLVNICSDRKERQRNMQLVNISG
jgi:hypothetical protein